MLDPDEALRLVRGSVRPLPPRELPLEECDGLALAEAVRARCDQPAWDNSAMDGYALRAAEAASATAQAPARLRVSSVAAAGGALPPALGPGEACRIMTGAPLPPGADAVVMRESAVEPAAGGTVEILEAPEPGQHIRRRGSDCRAGEDLLEAGRELRPADIALLASQGRARVRVVPRPRVAVVASGDELVDFRAEPESGRLRDSSRPALAAALRRWGAEPVDGGIARDDAAAVRAALAAALERADALFITGGVSVGDYDYTRRALAGLGFREVFWRVSIRPGKPLLYGLVGDKPVFGLPGNPVSTWVCAEVFARPAIARLAGRADRPRPFPARGVFARAFVKPERLRQYIFCAAREEGGRVLLEALEPQGSALLTMASRADALAVGPIGVARLEAGAEAEFRWLR